MDDEQEHNMYKLLLTIVTGLILATGIVLMSHLQIIKFRKVSGF